MEVQVLRAGVSADELAAQRRGVVVPVAALALALLIPVATLLVAAWSSGWRLQPIKTASMEPAYTAGSLAVVEPVDPSRLRPGMTVVFEDPLVRVRLVAHRLVKPLPGASRAWQTKGDANAEADPAPVHAAAIHGRVRWAVPRLGSVASAVHGPAALALLVGLPLAVLLLTEVGTFRRRRTDVGAAVGGRR